MATARCSSAPTRWPWRRSPAASPISKTATGRSSTSREVHDLRRATNARSKRRVHEHRAVRRPDRQGQFPPFHAEGDLRAAGGDRRHAARADRPVHAAPCTCPNCPSRSATSAKVDDHRLRHRVLCRAGREILVRAHRPHAGRGRHRLGVPLPRAATCRKAARRSSISQSGETADTLAALRYCRAAAAEDHRHRQPAGKLDRARGRHRAADPRRAGDRRRLDQGVHHAARGAGGADRGAGAGPRHDRRGGEAALAAPARRDPVARRRGAEPRRAHPGDRRRDRARPATCSISAAAPPIRWRSKAR